MATFCRKYLATAPGWGRWINDTSVLSVWRLTVAAELAADGETLAPSCPWCPAPISEAPLRTFFCGGRPSARRADSESNASWRHEWEEPNWTLTISLRSCVKPYSHYPNCPWSEWLYFGVFYGLCRPNAICSVLCGYRSCLFHMTFGDLLWVGTGSSAHWLERRSLTDFPWSTTDLSLTCDHFVPSWVKFPLWVNQPGQLSLPSLLGR